MKDKDFLELERKYNQEKQRRARYQELLSIKEDLRTNVAGCKYDKIVCRLPGDIRDKVQEYLEKVVKEEIDKMEAEND